MVNVDKTASIKENQYQEGDDSIKYQFWKRLLSCSDEKTDATGSSVNLPARLRRLNSSRRFFRSTHKLLNKTTLESLEVQTGSARLLPVCMLS